MIGFFQSVEGWCSNRTNGDSLEPGFRGSRLDISDDYPIVTPELAGTAVDFRNIRLDEPVAVTSFVF